MVSNKIRFWRYNSKKCLHRGDSLTSLFIFSGVFSHGIMPLKAVFLMLLVSLGKHSCYLSPQMWSCIPAPWVVQYVDLYFHWHSSWCILMYSSSKSMGFWTQSTELHMNTRRIYLTFHHMTMYRKRNLKKQNHTLKWHFNEKYSLAYKYSVNECQSLYTIPMYILSAYSMYVVFIQLKILIFCIKCKLSHKCYKMQFSGFF